MEHKCSGIPCYVYREEARKIIIKALEKDEVPISGLEWVLDSIFNRIHIVNN